MGSVLCRIARRGWADEHEDRAGGLGGSPTPLAHLHSFFVQLLVEGGAERLSAVPVTYGVAIVLLERAAWRRSLAPAFALAATVALLRMSGLDDVQTRTEVLLAGWILIAAGTGR